MGSLGITDTIIVVAYFALMLLLGLLAMRKNKSTDDYFVAGNQLGTFSLAAMWMSSWIGGASIVGTATDGYNLGISGGWYVFILAIGTFLFGMTFTKLVKRLGAKLKDITYPALITSRYDNRTGILVIVCTFLAGIGFLASQLVALASMLATMTGWDVFTCFIIGTVVTVAYSAIGGILAITYTTWVQFILIILGTVVLGIPLSAKAMGGFGGVSALPSEWFDLGRYGPATIIALGVSSVFSFYTSMDSYQRSFAAKSPRIAKNGTLWAALSIVFIAFGATYMGMSAKVLIPELPEGTSAYAALVMTYFPSGISGLVLVGVFAAIMSTGVVSINCCAANVSVDIYRDRVNPKAKDSTVKLLAVISSLVAGIVGAVLPWWQYDIVSLLLLAFTFQAASLFFPTVFGMFWKKPTAKAAFVSIIISMAVVLVWLICSALDVAPIFETDALWPGLVSSFLSFMALTLFGKPTPEDQRKAELFCSIAAEKSAD